MEWRQIIGFYHVARLRSFSRAAEATFRTQSALTQQIKTLEEELDCQLFERIGKRKIRLTPAGEKFLAFSEIIVDRYEELMDELSKLKGFQKGRLRIAAPFTTLYHLFPEALKHFMEQFPWIEITILDRSQSNVVELVKDGEIDFGIALESMVPKELSKIRWKRVEPVLLTPIGHPLTQIKKVSVRQIAQYPLILPPGSGEFSNRRKLEKLFHDFGMTYRIVMESSNVELSSLYVEIGLGISFATVACNLPGLRQRRLEFISLSHLLDPEYLAIILRKDKVLTPFKRAFIDILLENC